MLDSLDVEFSCSIGSVDFSSSDFTSRFDDPVGSATVFFTTGGIVRVRLFRGREIDAAGCLLSIMLVERDRAFDDVDVGAIDELAMIDGRVGFFVAE